MSTNSQNLAISTLEQCFPRPPRNSVERPAGRDWLEGQGIAISMHGAVPPTEHRSEAQLGLREDRIFRRIFESSQIDSKSWHLKYDHEHAET